LPTWQLIALVIPSGEALEHALASSYHGWCISPPIGKSQWQLLNVWRQVIALRENGFVA
jgi:hypothetical protein